MIDKSHTQARIKNLVSGYKTLFPEEYAAVCDAVIMQRQLQKDELASTKGEHVLGRKLYEISEKLYMSFVKELDSDELAYFKSTEGARWFTKTFTQFALTKI